MAGSIALIENFSPTPIVTALLLSDMLVGAALTETEQVVLTYPEEAVIVAVPGFIPLIFPFVTVTTEGLELFHVKAAFEGDTVVLRVIVSPTPRPVAVLSSLIEEAYMTGSFTVTTHEAVLPFEVFAVMMAVPAAAAVILPFETAATLLFEDVHVRDLLVVSSG